MTVRQLPFPRARAEGSARPALLRAWIQPALRDWGIVVSVTVVYFLLRGLAGWDEAFALRVTEVLIDFEKATHTFWEPQIQEISIRFYWVQELANFTYAYLHFPVLLGVALWLWLRERRAFFFMRNVYFMSMVFGLVMYFALPAAPPRLLELHGYDLGFVDTVFGTRTHVSYAQPGFILNEYAAIPSFHFGWIAMCSAIIWAYTPSRSLRALGIFLSAIMSWAIIASANHFWIDMALGGLIVALAWYVSRRFERQLSRLPLLRIGQPG